jgi:hypothetical protein
MGSKLITNTGSRLRSVYNQLSQLDLGDSVLKTNRILNEEDLNTFIVIL